MRRDRNTEVTRTLRTVYCVRAFVGFGFDMRKGVASMERVERSAILSEGIRVLLSVGAGAGIGWILWNSTKSHVFALGAAGSISALCNNFLRRWIK